MTASLALVGLFVRDLPRARAFYAERLGLEEVPQFSSDTFAFLKSAHGTPIALQTLDQLPPGANAQPGGAQLAFDVADLDATLRDWQAAGVPILTEIADMGAGRTFYALDPEGNLLGVSRLYELVREYRRSLGL